MLYSGPRPEFGRSRPILCTGSPGVTISNDTGLDCSTSSSRPKSKSTSRTALGLASRSWTRPSPVRSDLENEVTPTLNIAVDVFVFY